ncbi:flavin reductase family protein [Rhizobium sp. LEGMi135b]
MMSTIDPKQFRNALGHYASGITVVTSHANGSPLGFTCQSFHSVSLDPPLISLCVMLTSLTWPKIRDTGRFCVNVLAKDQRAVSDRFARSGTDKWTGQSWSPSAAGSPTIDESLLWLDCILECEHIAGDHLIAIGRVEEMSDAESPNDRAPLLFFKGRYHQLALEA